MIAREKKIMMMLQGGGVIDTSPIIKAYNSYYTRNGSIAEDNAWCITELYHYQTKANDTELYSYGLAPFLVVFKNGGDTFVDYWTVTSYATAQKKGKLDAGSDCAGFTISQSHLNDCYCYEVDSGNILFAGKNSIYYGHTNISELS